MLKYKFQITESWYPQILIDHNSIENYQVDMMLNEEINNLSFTNGYLDKIVQELEEVISWERTGTFFWYETSDISVYKKWYNLWTECRYPDWYDFPDGKVIINYNYNDDQLITDIPIEDILKMMTEWRDYIDVWEKETGKIKK